MKRIFGILIFLIFLFSSFDIFLNVNLGGFNVRACYLLVFVFAFLYIFTFDDAGSLQFLGAGAFLGWFSFLLLFVWNTPLLSRNIGYLAWLIFNCFTCYALYKFVRRYGTGQIIRLYILSFFLLALAGLLQFTLSQFGIHVLVTMWWEFGKTARVNAFSYEPSYYASYLLIGFVFLYFSQRKKIFYFSGKLQVLILSALVAAIFLSTSRMGILFMLSILAYDFMRMIFRAFLTARISLLNFIISLVLLLSLAGVITRILLDDELRVRYLAGTGLESTAAHSREVREEQVLNVWKIFEKSPLIGYSLGGIAPNIALMNGVVPRTVEETKDFEGLNVLLEVLAASGIVGFLFFAFWLLQIFYAGFRLSGRLRAAGFERESVLLNGLCAALLTELLILSFSQNILRPYLWILIGMLNAVYFQFRLLLQKPESAAEPLRIPE
jgi:O-antigen ligase